MTRTLEEIFRMELTDFEKIILTDFLGDYWFAFVTACQRRGLNESDADTIYKKLRDE